MFEDGESDDLSCFREPRVYRRLGDLYDSDVDSLLRLYRNRVVRHCRSVQIIHRGPL